MDERLSNFTQGIQDTILGIVALGTHASRFVGYAEGVEAARADDFDPVDYDAEDLFARYFG